MLAGCSAGHYRKSADKELYSIIQQGQTRAFGQTNAFSVETPYSHRDPQTISPEEIIGDRERTNTRVLTIEDGTVV